jgi:hypothetical protein
MPRLVSIDALRAVVMVLMIFVNDLWSLIGIPEWLEHAPGGANHMGLADVVFPAFLFIVGLSVPYAIESRRRKGDSDLKIFLHIASRSLALLIMGFFHVNMDSYSHTSWLPKGLWTIFVTSGFFLVWLDYSGYKPLFSNLLKVVGVIVLVLMAFFFDDGKHRGLLAMKPHWWGILGLIGWGYLLSSIIFLCSKGRFYLQVLAFVFFMAFNAFNYLGWLHSLEGIHRYVWIAENGAMPALPMAGIITAMLYRKFTAQDRHFWLYIAAFAAILFAFSWLTHPLWGLSKIRATPSWVALTSGVTLVAFGGLVYFNDILNRRNWYEWIKPAGTSTLTCYLLPYVHYALIGLLNLPQLPAALRTGELGLLKSLCMRC